MGADIVEVLHRPRRFKKPSACGPPPQHDWRHVGCCRLTFCGDQLGLPNLTHRTNASGRNTELAGIPENDTDETWPLTNQIALGV